MSKPLVSKMNNMKVSEGPGNTTKARRRLSVAASANAKSFKLDGGGLEAEAKTDVGKSSTDAVGKIVKHSSLSKVGYVPFNNSKVNQDRASVHLPFKGDDSKSFWGVFDGHGSLGHDVSTFVAKHLPEITKGMLDAHKTPPEALHHAFVDCNTKLAKGKTDCTFSGTTVIVVYIDGDQLYSANAGDSRACLGKVTNQAGKFKAVALSDDQKPERADERKRIIARGGRVAACKGMRGEDIGPQRVWLKHQEVPGLAMTRSFGDLIAASVGVIPEPEVWTRTIEPDDAFIILASDGVWEFIENQEAVDVVGAAKSPDEAVRNLTNLATERWKAEEEVIDDITAVIAYFK